MTPSSRGGHWRLHPASAVLISCLAATMTVTALDPPKTSEPKSNTSSPVQVTVLDPPKSSEPKNNTSSLVQVTASDCPKIFEPEHNTYSTKQGENCTIPCTAYTTYKHFSLVYWMVNNRFLEDVYPEGRVKEENQRVEKHEDLYQVQKPLVITSVQEEDFTRMFTCVLQDPSGFDVKNITLVKRRKKVKKSTANRRSPRPPKMAKRKNRKEKARLS